MSAILCLADKQKADSLCQIMAEAYLNGQRENMLLREPEASMQQQPRRKKQDGIRTQSACKPESSPPWADRTCRPHI